MSRETEHKLAPLAVTVLYVPKSDRDCLVWARIWPWLSYICQHLTVTILYMPESGRDYFICATAGVQGVGDVA